jgi:hypothetical protein
MRMEALHGLVDSPHMEFRFTISSPGSLMIKGRLCVYDWCRVTLFLPHIKLPAAGGHIYVFIRSSHYVTPCLNPVRPGGFGQMASLIHVSRHLAQLYH